MQSTQEPILSRARLRNTYRFKKHRAELYDNVPSNGIAPFSIIYRYVMAVIPDDPEGTRMYIASETSPGAISKGEPSFLCVYRHFFGGSHANYGSDAAWDNLEGFTAKAKAMICEMLTETEALPPETIKNTRESPGEAKSNRDAFRLKMAVILAGLFLEIAGVVLIVMDFQSQGSVTVKAPIFEGTINATYIGLFVIFIGMVLQAISVLKPHTIEERKSKETNSPAASAPGSGSGSKGSVQSPPSYKEESYTRVSGSRLSQPRR